MPPCSRSSNTLRERILKGEDFAGLAKTLPRIRARPADGGDLGWAGPGTFVPEFEQAVAGAEGRRDQRALPHPVRLAHRAGAGAPPVRQHRRAEAPPGHGSDPRQQGRRGNRAVAAPPARRSVRRVQVLSASRAIALTSGEPAGIGPELCLALAAPATALRAGVSWLTASCSPRARGNCGCRSTLRAYVPGGARVAHTPGRLLRAARAARRAERAGHARHRATPATCCGCSIAPSTARCTGSSTPWSPRRCTRASSTMPASPSPATPNTWRRAPAARLPVMLLAAGELRVALATTHLPLKAVSAAHHRRVAVRYRAPSLAAALQRCWGIAVAAHRRVRPEPARRRGRPSRATRRSQSSRRRSARLQANGIARHRPAAGGHGVRAAGAGGLRRGAGDVPRPGPAGDQARRLRARRQRHARPADPAHLGGSRHRARSGRHRQGRLRQPAAAVHLAAASRRSRADATRGGRDPRAAPQALRSALPARPGGDRAHRWRRSRRAPGITCVEIGPGRGALTRRLLACR